MLFKTPCGEIDRGGSTPPHSQTIGDVAHEGVSEKNVISAHIGEKIATMHNGIVLI
ncbi:hypothetical protein PHAMO_30148 [Magnetospirillum molischianum DSM 120]|uniref:Uncharacterized protein n=1 Tax=Magnetospirillum molischianum DSM 120 TaxID=1150626 RepID=H8FUF4_MAGML|nr:hypothetical protein PHAMO_30148 [Magnetospirillum molischianum DSM 120]